MRSRGTTTGRDRRKGIRRHLSMAIAVLGVLSLLLGAPAAATDRAGEQAPEPEFVGELGIGDALFWHGPYLESVGTGTRAADPVLCDSPIATYLSCIPTTEEYPALAQASAVSAIFADIEGPFCEIEHRCFTYTFDIVATAGKELRVAFDQPSLRDKFGMALYDPNGEFVALTGLPPGELRIPDPMKGRWRVRVEAFDVRDSSFRMRAALDPVTAGPGRGGRGGNGNPNRPPVELLPNLQVVPPFELGFAACQPTEIVQYGAQRCLRFSTGPANVGDGPLDMVITENGQLSGQMFQRVHRTDGTHQVYDAGDFEWHPEHLHYHVGAIQSLELLRVTDPRRGGLEPAGSGPKLGFCLLPYHIAEWGSFAQDPPFEIYDDNSCASIDPPLATQMALARGWVDIYQWWVEGNFVEFGDNPDGLYVVRAQSDPDGNILETDNRDNVAYTYIRVRGDEIEVLERGRGAHPWDPHRVIVDDFRRLTRWEG